MKYWHRNIVLLLMIVLCFASSASAGEQGHYTPAPLGVRDFVLPPKGVYFLNYNTYYTADTFKDSSGDKVDSLNVSGTLTRNVSIRNRSLPVTVSGTLNVDLDIDIDVFVQALGVAVVTDKKILGADYGFIILPSWGHTSVDVEATADASGTISVGPFSRSFSANQSVEIEDEETGLADFFIQPLWLGWHGKHYDIGLSWGAYLPTGSYDENEIANVGFGFYTSQTQASFYYYPFENKATAIMFAPTWEVHSKNIDKDVTPGQNVTIEYGIGQYLHERFEVGVHGYHQWQVTEDKGDDAVNEEIEDMVSGIAGQVTFWPVKEKLALVGKYVHEYGAEDRLEGHFGQFNLLWIF